MSFHFSYRSQFPDTVYCVGSNHALARAMEIFDPQAPRADQRRRGLAGLAHDPGRHAEASLDDDA